MNIMKAVGTCVIGVMVSGCSIIGVKDVEPSVFTLENNDIVARDFATALMDLRGHDPKNTTLQVRASASTFGDAMNKALRNTGYGIQTIADDDSGPMEVSYQMDSYDDGMYESAAYRLKVGAVELGREYEIRAGKIFPVTSLSVKGVEIGSKPLNETMFNLPVRSSSPPPDNRFFEPAPVVEPKPPKQPVLKPNELTASIDNTSEVTLREVEEIVGATTGALSPVIVPTVSKAASPSIAKSKPSYNVHRSLKRADTNVGKTNMITKGTSNFADLFKRYTTLNDAYIWFGNDSTQLGPKARHQLASVLKPYNPKTDVIQVIGCSHGSTTVDNGNEVLALGRRDTVVETIMAMEHIPANTVFEEVCYAGMLIKKYPSKGVIVSLKRENSVAVPKLKPGNT